MRKRDKRMSKWDCLYLAMKLRLKKTRKRIREFCAFQDGKVKVAMIIAIIILLILVLLAKIFWDQISAWVEDQMCTIPPRLPEQSMY